jgi:hypothetical protein
LFVDGKKVDAVVGASPDRIRSKIDMYKAGGYKGATRSAPAMQKAAPVVAAPAPEAAPAPAKRGRKARGCTSCKSCK